MYQEAILPDGSSEKGLRILVVDDNSDVADSIAILLKLWGHTVEIAYGGQAALDQAVAFRPEAVLLDIWMPGMHGGEVARHFRQLAACKDLLIIAITAHPSEDRRLDEWQEHFDAVLGKPCNLTRLENLLAAHVAGGR
jgi:CheY-like chemotaxis protein